MQRVFRCPSQGVVGMQDTRATRLVLAASGMPWCSMPKLRSLAPLVRTVNTSTTPLLPKVKAPEYTTPQFRAWRAVVVGRAGARCEYHDHHGHRCTRAQPEYRMYADHIVELRDGGAVHDSTNGQCLCYMNHTIKTNEVRKKRLQNIN